MSKAKMSQDALEERLQKFSELLEDVGVNVVVLVDDGETTNRYYHGNYNACTGMCVAMGHDMIRGFGEDDSDDWWKHAK